MVFGSNSDHDIVTTGFFLHSRLNSEAELHGYTACNKDGDDGELL